ncbi:MAG: SpoIIE family protein phosphatase [Chloroflexi bacterium]|nr:SpoIIE family protein phosphatase [Chloroflexota bacterium]
MNEKSVDPAHLETLYEVTRYLNSSLDMAEVLNMIMDRVVQVTNAERGFLVLVDEVGETWEFQVARGMDQQVLDTPEFEVSSTIIREVISSREPLLTLNAQYDKRLGGQSIVAKGLRSILCVPILVRQRLIGLVYVDNRLKAGIFDEGHRDLLVAFASEAGFAIENARLYKLAVDQGRMQRELEMAWNIQRGLLPAQFEPVPGYEVAFDWQAAREVAGDFYDFFKLDHSQMGVVVADVSDKGAAAAIYMAVARSLFRGNAYANIEPTETVQQTNTLLLEDSTGGMFVTLYYAVFGDAGLVQCVNAGHNRPMLYRASDDHVEFLPKGGTPLGWFPTIKLKMHQYHLQLGDVMIFYTDGLTEAENISQEPYGEERLVQTVRESAGQPAGEIKAAILESVRDFEGNAPAFDDLTLVVVRYVGT